MGSAILRTTIRTGIKIQRPVFHGPRYGILGTCRHTLKTGKHSPPLQGSSEETLLPHHAKPLHTNRPLSCSCEIVFVRPTLRHSLMGAGIAQSPWPPVDASLYPNNSRVKTFLMAARRAGGCCAGCRYLSFPHEVTPIFRQLPGHVEMVLTCGLPEDSMTHESDS